MFSNNEKISLRQLQVLLILQGLGTGVLFLPKEIAKAGGSAGVLGVVLGSLFMVVVGMGYGLLLKNHPQQPLLDIIASLWGKPVAVVVGVVFFLKLLVAGAFSFRLFCQVMQESIFFQTPIWMVGGCLLLLALLLTGKGYECRGRLGEILFFVAFLPLLLTLVMAFFGIKGESVRGAFSIHGTGYGKTIGITFFSFYGVEFLLFAAPLLRNPEKAVKALGQAGILVVLVLTVITFLTVSVLGISQTQGKLFPVLSMINTVEFPGFFWERQDIVMLWFWLVSALLSLGGTLYFCSGIGQKVVEKSQRKWVVVVAVLVLLVSALPRDLGGTLEGLRWVNGYGGLVTVVFIPLVVFLADCWKGRGKP